MIDILYLWFQKIEAFEHRMYSHPLHKDPTLDDMYNQYEDKVQVWIVLFLQLVFQWFMP